MTTKNATDLILNITNDMIEAMIASGLADAEFIRATCRKLAVMFSIELDTMIAIFEKQLLLKLKEVKK